MKRKLSPGQIYCKAEEVEVADPLAKKVKTKTEERKDRTDEKKTEVSSEEVKTEETTAEEVKTEEKTAEEIGSMTRAEIKTAKISKLKELLGCIQQYAQFTSSQLVGKHNFDGDVKLENYELFHGELRDYQVEGVRWLRMLHDLAVNGILADEMGLGKTVMVIAMIAGVIKTGAPGPFLVIAPLSTLPNWISELQRFAPDLPVVLFHGDAKKRKLLRLDVEMTHSLPAKYHPARTVRPVVVTSYEMVISDATFLSRIDWRMLVVDEAQRLKNDSCILRSKLRKFTTPRRLILTGTPIQNSLTELWSLMSFLMPDIFKSGLASFESLLDEILSDDSSLWIADEGDARQKEEILQLLHKILRPFILRRLKCDVDLTIPPKKEVVVKCSLSKKQAELYGKLIDNAITQAVRTRKGELEESQLAQSDKRNRQKTIFFGVNDEDEEEEFVGGYFEEMPGKVVLNNSIHSDEEDDTKETEEEMSVDYWLESWGQLSLRNLLMQLRKCVNHPYLFRRSYVINENFIKVSGKLQLLDAMLQKLFERPADGHKVIIYSQFVMNLDILAQYCEYRDWKFVRIDGSTNLEDRGVAIKQFTMDPKTLVFLVSTRAGGLGINLTAADTVFLYDSDWNPQMDLQARDRCHRIGQTRPVVVYRLIVSNTVDAQMWECAVGKRRLERVVLHQAAFQNATDSLLGAAKQDYKPAKGVSKMSFTIGEMVDILKQRDWEERDDSALNFDSPDAEVERRIAELLDRSDLEEEWRQAIRKAAIAKPL